MSGGGGGGQTVQTSNSSSEQGPPTPIAWALNDMAGQLIGHWQKNPNAPAFYPGQTVAGFSPQTNRALTALMGRGNHTSPVLGAASGSVRDTLGGKYLDIGGNPYFQKALAAGFEPQTRQFMTSVLPGLTAQFSGAGRYGSGQQRAYTGLALDSLNRAQADAAAQTSAGAYTRERGNQMQAASLAPQLAGTASNIDLQNIEAMLRAGQITDRQAQRLIDEQIARYNYQRNAQADYIANLARQLQAIYPGGSARGSNQSFSSTMRPGRDPLSSILDGVLGLGGALRGII